MKSLLLALFVMLIPLQSYAVGPDWLLGEWVMTFDPDGDTEDRLTFLKGGEFVTTETASGEKIKGMYSVKSDHIKVNLIYQGKLFMKLKLTFDKVKDKLYYYSSETGNTAYYTKIK